MDHLAKDAGSPGVTFVDWSIRGPTEVSGGTGWGDSRTKTSSDIGTYPDGEDVGRTASTNLVAPARSSGPFTTARMTPSGR